MDVWSFDLHEWVSRGFLLMLRMRLKLVCRFCCSPTLIKHVSASLFVRICIFTLNNMSAQPLLNKFYISLYACSSVCIQQTFSSIVYILIHEFVCNKHSKAIVYTVDSRYLKVQKTEILRNIRTLTYQICRIEEKKSNNQILQTNM